MRRDKDFVTRKHMPSITHKPKDIYEFKNFIGQPLRLEFKQDHLLITQGNKELVLSYDCIEEERVEGSPVTFLFLVIRPYKRRRILYISDPTALNADLAELHERFGIELDSYRSVRGTWLTPNIPLEILFVYFTSWRRDAKERTLIEKD